MDEATGKRIARRREVLSEVRRILVDNLKLDREPETIDPDVPLFGTGLGLDSVDAVELLVALETELGVVVPEEADARAHLRTVNTMVELVLAFHGELEGSTPTVLGGAPRAAVEPSSAGEGPATSEAGMHALRTATAFSRSSEMLAVRLSGADPFEALDPLVTSDLFLRDGQMHQSLFLDDSGHPIADLYVAHDDGDLWLLVEGMEADEVESCLAGSGATVTSYARDHEIVSVHGPWAWELMGNLLGEDLIALPYLSFFHLEEGTCFRGGKTGEYGYDLLLPRERVEPFVERLLQVGSAFGLREIGRAELEQAKRETFFFDVERWRGEDVTPAELQLLWRCSRRKRFRGGEALEKRRRDLERRVTCVLSSGPMRPGAWVSADEQIVGQVVHAGFSRELGAWVGHALVERSHAEAGIEGLRVDGSEACTVAPPVLDNWSLAVDPRRHVFAEHETAGFRPVGPRWARVREAP